MKKNEAITETKNPLVFTDISTVKIHRVINTPYRITDVLEHVDGEFELRDVILENGRRNAGCIVVHFQPYELINLGEIIRRIFEAGPPVKARANGR